MKKLKFLLFVALTFGCTYIVSCSKSGNSPVDQYVELLDQATKKAEKISSMSDLTNVQGIISPQEAMKIVSDNSDYELTDNDKEKLKKSYDKLLKVAYEKTAEYGGVPEEYKEQVKTQVDLIIEAANKGIDNAKTLGDLNGIQ